MAYTGNNFNLEESEQLGAFSGYIRRPTPNNSGMTAQVFGENGEDADTIVALSLSKYQDREVFVNIYIVKDSNGRVMKTQGKYPVISSFYGFVRRSLPKKDGMIAQFFAPNGENADNVSNLSKSEYLDCLVFVDIRGKKVDNIAQLEKENMHIIETVYSNKITKNEREEFQRKEKSFRKMNELLEIDFLNKIEVVSSIGNVEEFKEWLINTQTCSHVQEKACLNQSGVIQIQGLVKPFNYLPVCDEHIENLSNQDHIDSNIMYYEMKQRLLIKSWVWNKFKQQFSYDGKSEPEPNKIIEWAASKKLSKYLPQKYVAIV